MLAQPDFHSCCWSHVAFLNSAVSASHAIVHEMANSLDIRGIMHHEVLIYAVHGGDVSEIFKTVREL